LSRTTPRNKWRAKQGTKIADCFARADEVIE